MRRAAVSSSRGVIAAMAIWIIASACALDLTGKTMCYADSDCPATACVANRCVARPRDAAPDVSAPVISADAAAVEPPTGGDAALAAEDVPPPGDDAPLASDADGQDGACPPALMCCASAGLKLCPDAVCKPATECCQECGTGGCDPNDGECRIDIGGDGWRDPPEFGNTITIVQRGAVLRFKYAVKGAFSGQDSDGFFNDHNHISGFGLKGTVIDSHRITWPNGDWVR